MKSSSGFRVLAVLLLAAFLFSCSTSKSSRSEASQSSVHAKAAKERRAAPDFALKDANGATVKLSDYRGKVVLLNFWATWCGPCVLEIPWFQEFEQQYKSKGFEVLGVSMDEDGWTAIKPYVTAHKLNYRVVLGDDSVSQLYGGLDALPTTFIIDRDGKFGFAPHVGLAGKDEYNNEIQSLLGETENAALHSRLGPPALLQLPTAK